MINDKPLQTSITHGRQKYVDEPIRIMPRPRNEQMELALAIAFGYLDRYLAEEPKLITIGHERQILRWIKPGDNPRPTV